MPLASLARVDVLLSFWKTPSGFIQKKEKQDRAFVSSTGNLKDRLRYVKVYELLLPIVIEDRLALKIASSLFVELLIK